MSNTKSGMKRKNCNICTRTIAINHRHIKCISCKSSIHIKCNHTDVKTFNNILKNNIPQTCFKCQSQNLPFNTLSDNQLSLILHKNVCEKSCKICRRTIAKNHRFIHCQTCDLKVHIKCNLTDVKTYTKIVNDKLPQNCFNCDSINIPFHSLEDLDFFYIINAPKENLVQPPPQINPIKMKCGMCEKHIAKNHRYLHCDSCNREVHIKCNKFDDKTYEFHKEKSIICFKCKSENIPFQHLTDLQLCAVNRGLNTDTEVLQEVSVTSTGLKNFFNEINKSNPFEDRY